MEEKLRQKNSTSLKRWGGNSLHSNRAFHMFWHHLRGCGKDQSSFFLLAPKRPIMFLFLLNILTKSPCLAIAWSQFLSLLLKLQFIVLVSRSEQKGSGSQVKEILICDGWLPCWPPMHAHQHLELAFGDAPYKILFHLFIGTPVLFWMFFFLN